MNGWHPDFERGASERRTRHTPARSQGRVDRRRRLQTSHDRHGGIALRRAGESRPSRPGEVPMRRRRTRRLRFKGWRGPAWHQLGGLPMPEHRVRPRRQGAYKNLAATVAAAASRPITEPKRELPIWRTQRFIGFFGTANGGKSDRRRTPIVLCTTSGRRELEPRQVILFTTSAAGAASSAVSSAGGVPPVVTKVDFRQPATEQTVGSTFCNGRILYTTENDGDSAVLPEACDDQDRCDRPGRKAGVTIIQGDHKRHMT